MNVWESASLWFVAVAVHFRLVLADLAPARGFSLGTLILTLKKPTPCLFAAFELLRCMLVHCFKPEPKPGWHMVKHQKPWLAAERKELVLVSLCEASIGVMKTHDFINRS